MQLSVYSPYVWLILMIGFLIIEGVTIGLASIWFALGALVAFFVSLICGEPVVQLVAFVGISFLTLISVRPLVKKKINGRQIKTNTQALIGETAIVTEPIDNMLSQGKVMVNGMDWTARSFDDSIRLKKGENVLIKEISGVKLIVIKKEGA